MPELFNPQQLRAQLRPLAGREAPFTLSDAETVFCRYYQLHCDNAQQQMGYVELAGFRIAVHRFTPKTTDPARGTLLLVHGYHDHHALYGHLIRYALQRGLAVLAFDLPGHGLSSGTTGAISGFGQYQDVLKGLIDICHQQMPGPLHLMGQSTGGAIISDYLLRRQLPPDAGVVLLAPLVQPAGWQGIKLLHSLLRPILKQVPRSFACNSHDARFLTFLKDQDPLQSRHVSVAWVSALRDWVPQFLALPSLPATVLVVQGEEDSTVDWRYNIPVLQDKFPALQLLRLAQGRHQLANESEQIRKKMLNWLDTHWQV